MRLPRRLFPYTLDSRMEACCARIDLARQCLAGAPGFRGRFWAPIAPAAAGPRRLRLADYVRRRMRRHFDLLIADEMPELKARGLAAGTLAEACGKL